MSAISQLREKVLVAGMATEGSESPGSEPQQESLSLDLSTELQQSDTADSALMLVICGAAQHELEGLCL